jgi:hypothetical protein
LNPPTFSRSTCRTSARQLAPKCRVEAPCDAYQLAHLLIRAHYWASIQSDTADRFERERDEACEAILRVEGFCEQMETEKFWLEYGGPAVVAATARIRAELKPRV